MKRRATLLCLTLSACGVACAPLARADYDPIASGATRLTLDPSFLALLKRNGVELSAVAPARLRRGVAIFPVAGGKFDPTNGKGTLRHEGALLLRDHAGQIPLKTLQLKTTSPHSPFSAKVGGSQLKLATGKAPAVSRDGFGDRVRTGSLALSAKVAVRLAKKLDLRGVVKAGQPLGKSLTTAQPQTVTLLPKGKLEMTLDPGFEAKLRSLFVAVNPIFPAEHPGAFTLPIFAGRLAPGGSEGVLQTLGSLEFLQLGGGQVFWAEEWLDLATRAASPEIDTEPSPPYAGKVGRTAVAVLGGAAFAADPKARTFSLSRGLLILDAATATTFNEVFAKPQGREGVFVAGEALGSLSFIAQGQ